MSVKEQKYGWFRNWAAARDKVRAAAESKNSEDARYWAGVALAIEMGFSLFFNQNFGEYLTEVV